MKEKWLPVRGFEGVYEVSNFGRVKSVDRKIVHKKDRFSDGKTQYVKGVIKKPQLHKAGKGYYAVQLFRSSKHHKRYIHRLVAEAFVDNPNNKEQVNHKDGNPKNNHFENLEWVTHSENLKHAIDTKLQIKNKPVRRIDSAGNVKEYDSMKDAAKDGFVVRDSISKCCKGEKETYKGYRWEFINQKV